jgi:hypothetical protein
VGTATLESDRLNALYSLSILDTAPEDRFDRITRVAAALFGTQISTVTLIDEDRQWHKACVGVSGREDDRAMSFCSVAIERPEPLIVFDAGPALRRQPAGHRPAVHPFLRGPADHDRGRVPGRRAVRDR